MAGQVETAPPPIQTPPLVDESQLGGAAAPVEPTAPAFTDPAQLGSAAPAMPPDLAARASSASALQTLAEGIYRQYSLVAEAQAEERKGLLANADRDREVYAGLTRGMIAATQARNARVADLEASRPEITPPPRREIQQFLAPREGESAFSTVSKLIQAMGLFATGIGGLARGDARAGLAAFSGAMRGWAEGDEAKATRDLETWRARTNAAVANWNLERDSYLEWLGASNMSLDTMLKGAELDAKVRGNEQAARAFQTGEMTTALKFLESQFKTTFEVQQSLAQFDEGVRRHNEQMEERRQRDQDRHEEALARQKIDADYKAQIVDLRYLQLQQQRDALEAKVNDNALNRETRLEAARILADVKRQQVQMSQENRLMSQKYYDRDTGMIRQIGADEYNADATNKATGHPRFTLLNAPELGQVERLVSAKPMLDRMDKIIQAITVEHPGQNLTTGLMQRLKQDARYAPILQEFEGVALDESLELAAAASGSPTPRITILKMIRHHGIPGLFMTTDTALRQNQVARTVVGNKVTQLTGDPDALDKLAAHLRAYVPNPLESGADDAGILKKRAAPTKEETRPGPGGTVEWK